MAFKPVNFAHLSTFNSAASSDFLQMYEKYIDNKIIARNAEPKHKTFAPSSFRCPRISWFRLRGVQPDIVQHPDRRMDWTAEIGTACHEIIQRNLVDALGADWIDVKEHLKNSGVTYSYEVTTKGYETLIDIKDPPVRFACDGIILINGVKYLLEIKTSEFASFNELTDPKEQHVDQIRFYATLLNLDRALVLYQDRQYGDLKCYEMKITESDKQTVRDRIRYVQDMVEANLAPDRLDKSDPWCSSNHCPYFAKCKEWG